MRFDAGAPALDPVETSPFPPRVAEVAIVGGGIVGLSAALYLAQRGVSVVVCEKGRFGAEQSSRNWGWVRRMGRDPRELPLIVEAMRLWDGMAASVGRDVGFRRSGILYLSETEADLQQHRDWLDSAGDYALDTRVIQGEELSALLPGAARSFHAALYTPSDGRAEPQQAAPAIAAAARNAGASLIADCAVTDIESAAGRVCGIVTEHGRIAASSVVIAGGVWSSALLRAIDVRLPQLGVRSSVLRTGPVAGGPDNAAWAPGFAYRKRADGGYTIAEGVGSRHDIVADSFRFFNDFRPLMRRERRHVALRPAHPFAHPLGASPLRARLRSARVLDPQPSKRQLQRAYAAIQRTFPIFRDVPVVQQWAGVIDATPDALPVISAIDSRPGLFVATGFSGHGFGIAPGAGRLIADLATAAAPLVDPTPFRYARFTDGTEAEPTTGV